MRGKLGINSKTNFFRRMGSLYMPVVELDEDTNIDVKLKDVKFKSINLLKVGR